jgi:hypothetical protein
MSIFNYFTFRIPSHFFAIAIVAGFLTSGVTHAQTPGPKKQAPAPAPSAAAEKSASAEKKARPIPFHGTLGAVSPTARTITVGKREFQLTSETKIYKGDNRAAGTLGDAKVGAPVTGSYVKNPDGKLIARSVFFKSPKTDATTEVSASKAKSP